MKKKKVVFYECESTYAKFRIRLAYDRLKQNDFFCFLVDCYIENDPGMLKIIEKYKTSKSTMGKKKLASTSKDFEKSKSSLKKIGISESEKDAMFDMIEEEIGEI